MPLVGLKPTVSADERSQTYALECAATGTEQTLLLQENYLKTDIASEKSQSRERVTQASV